MRVKELKADMVGILKTIQHKAEVEVVVLGAIALHSSLIANPKYSKEEQEAILGEINMKQVEDLITCQAINN
tara:strand:- start:2486 stop:2701 length:216 start_codon:yes stop_codon:yes gene_type:complete